MNDAETPKASKIELVDRARTGLGCWLGSGAQQQGFFLLFLLTTYVMYASAASYVSSKDLQSGISKRNKPVHAMRVSLKYIVPPPSLEAIPFHFLNYIILTLHDHTAFSTKKSSKSSKTTKSTRSSLPPCFPDS